MVVMHMPMFMVIRPVVIIVGIVVRVVRVIFWEIVPIVVIERIMIMIMEMAPIRYILIIVALMIMRVIGIKDLSHL